MDPLTAFGLASVAAMLAFYTLEERSQSRGVHGAHPSTHIVAVPW